MKKILAIITVAAITAMAGSAMAATTSTDLTVSASVSEVCTAVTNTNIDFGNLDPVGDPATTSTATKTGATRGVINVKCTQGTGYKLSAPATATIANGGDTITYTPVVPLADFTGIVAGTSHTIDATVDKSAYASVPTGAYAGTLTVTVTY
jgi:spore coat protein U-like protein